MAHEWLAGVPPECGDASSSVAVGIGAAETEGFCVGGTLSQEGAASAIASAVPADVAVAITSAPAPEISVPVLAAATTPKIGLPLSPIVGPTMAKLLAVVTATDRRFCNASRRWAAEEAASKDVAWFAACGWSSRCGC